MNERRIVFNNWIAETGRLRGDTAGHLLRQTDHPDEGGSSTNDICQAVEKAFGPLTEDEHEIVVRYYFMGESMVRIGASSGRRPSALHSLLQRALRKIRRRLASFVAERFDLVQVEQSRCHLCDSPYRPQIDLLLKNRDRQQTWKPVMAALKSRYGICVSTPQMLIGHEKYHM